jgi:mRNA interferase RelE/StbE
VGDQVNWEIRALDWRRASSATIPLVSPLSGRVSRLAEEPRPPESFAYGSPDLRRLRADRYRVLYTIDEERRVVQIDHVARLP